MYKLMFFMILFSIGFSELARAQYENNIQNIETLSQAKIKDYGHKSKEELVVEYKPSKNATKYKNKAKNNELQFYRSWEKPTKNYTNQTKVPSHKNTTINSISGDLKNVPAKNASHSINRDKHHLEKEN